jgi:hypothetical protein
MTSEKSSPTSKAELQAELQAVLLRAYENGIDVRGGVECQNGGKHPDWDVVITEVEKNHHSA